MIVQNEVHQKHCLEDSCKVHDRGKNQQPRLRLLSKAVEVNCIYRDIEQKDKNGVNNDKVRDGLVFMIESVDETVIYWHVFFEVLVGEEGECQIPHIAEEGKNGKEPLDSFES